MINQIKSDAEARMKKCLEVFHADLAKLRTGRAHPSLLDQVMVSYYGKDTPLSQVASITVGDARTLVVSPWEKALVPTIEKALLTSGLGLNPATTGTVIRVPLPALNEERRKEMIRIVRAEAENSRVAVRNVRRDANNYLKDLLKKKEVNEDEERRAQENIQKLTDNYVTEIDKILATKEKELMTV